MSDLNGGWARKSRFDYETMSAIIDPQGGQLCYGRRSVIIVTQ